MTRKVLHAAWRTTQVCGVLLANAYMSVVSRQVIYKGPLKCTCLPFIYCHACPSSTFSCPIGTLQHYMAIRKFPFELVGHITLLGLLIGRMACGWLCPFGLVQDLLNRTTGKNIRLPRALVGLSVLALLLLVLLIPYLTAEHWFSKLCPLGMLVAGIPWVTWNPINPETGAPTVAAGSVGLLFAVKFLVLVGFLGLFFFSKRPFCRFVCPMGLVLSLFNRVSLVQLSVAPSCTRCGACEKNCPVGIRVYEDPNSRECVRCLQCTACKHVEVVTPVLRRRPKADAIEEMVLADCMPGGVMSRTDAPGEGN